MEIISYIIVNLFIFSSWYIFLFKRRYYISFIDRLIGTFILGLAQIIFTEMLLGVLFKRLFAAPLFLFNISISLIVLTLAIIFDKNNNPPLPSLSKGGMGGLKGILSEFKDKTIQFFNIIKRDIVLLCIFILFLISVCWIIFTGYLFPSYTWDALWYHLPTVGYIIQSGAIQENITPSFIDLFINIFPKNIELFFIWNTIFLKSDIIIDLSQLFFTIAGIFTIYSIAVKLGLKEEYAVYSSLLFFFAPVIILQSTTNYIDIAVAVLFLIAINFLMYDDPRNFSGGVIKNKKLPILLAGLATGILVGSKGSGPLFIAVLLVMVIMGKFIRYINPFNIFSSEYKKFSVKIIPPHPPLLRGGRGDSQGKSSFVLYLVYFIVPAALMGGYWYIKNLVVYSNPVYPIEVSFFNIKLFKGLYGGIIDPVPDALSRLSPLGKLFYVWREKVEYYLYDSRLSGFGPIWFILLLPSTVIAVFYAIKRKIYNFLFLSVILTVTFIIYPRNWYTRYVVFILGLGTLSFGLALDYFERGQRAIKIITLLLVMYTFFFSNSPCIMPWKIKEFINLPPEERVIARHAPFNIDLQARQDYGLWVWISNNMLDSSVLAYTFEPLFLAPLWNSGFTNKIAYVKSEKFNKWVESLKNNQTTHVLIKQNSIEDGWIKEVGTKLDISSGRFDVVYSDKNYKVLKFNY